MRCGRQKRNTGQDERVTDGLIRSLWKECQGVCSKMTLKRADALLADFQSIVFTGLNRGSNTTVVDHMVSWFHTLSFSGGWNYGNDPGPSDIASRADGRNRAGMDARADGRGAPDWGTVSRWDARCRAGASLRGLLGPWSAKAAGSWRKSTAMIRRGVQHL